MMFGVPDRNVRDSRAISQLTMPTEIVRDVIYYDALSIRLSATVLTVRCVMAFAYYGVYTRAISLPIRLSVCPSPCGN